MKSKKLVSIIMALICLISSFSFAVNAIDKDNAETRASGLIYQFNLEISKETNTILSIEGLTDCDPVVVKCGFKNLMVQRRVNISSSWSDFYDYGNLYLDDSYYALGKYLPVDPGYQYRVTCKHYAKKNALNIQTISNTSNIVTF